MLYRDTYSGFQFIRLCTQGLHLNVVLFGRHLLINEACRQTAPIRVEPDSNLRPGFRRWSGLVAASVGALALGLNVSSSTAPGRCRVANLEIFVVAERNAAVALGPDTASSGIEADAPVWINFAKVRVAIHDGAACETKTKSIRLRSNGDKI